ERNKASEDDHAISGDSPDGFQQTNINQNAKQRAERCAEPADQAIGQAMNAEHHVKITRFDIGCQMRIEASAQASQRAGNPCRKHLMTRDGDALQSGKRLVLTDHPEDHAETGTFEQHEPNKRGHEHSVDQKHEVEGVDVVFEYVADIAKAIGAVWPDPFAID